MSSAESDIFTSFFLRWIPFISISYLIAVTKTSNTMLNKDGESRQLCLVPDLRGNALTIEYGVSCGLIIHGLYHIEVCSLYTHFVESFYHKWMLNFVRSFFCLYPGDHIIFILHLGNVAYHID